MFMRTIEMTSRNIKYLNPIDDTRASSIVRPSLADIHNPRQHSILTLSCDSIYIKLIENKLASFMYIKHIF